jgi:hypothetical protein
MDANVSARNVKQILAFLYDCYQCCVLDAKSDTGSDHNLGSQGTKDLPGRP